MWITVSHQLSLQAPRNMSKLSWPYLLTYQSEGKSGCSGPVMCSCTTTRWDWADNKNGSQGLRYYCRSRREPNLKGDTQAGRRGRRITTIAQVGFINETKTLWFLWKDRYLARFEKTNPEALHWVWKCRHFSQCVIINPQAAILGISSPHKQSTGTADLKHHHWKWSIIAQFKAARLSQTEERIWSFTDCQK